MCATKIERRGFKTRGRACVFFLKFSTSVPKCQLILSDLEEILRADVFLK